MPNIKPVSDLSKYSEVLRDVAVGAPVFLTDDGLERYVIMEICDYKEVQKVNDLINELLKEDHPSEDNVMAALESPYVRYSMQGLNNLRISHNTKMPITHPLIKSVSIQDDLKCFALELNKGIQYIEHKSAIDLYASQLFFSLVVQTDADIDQPRKLISAVADGTRNDLFESALITDHVEVSLKVEPVDFVYSMINTAPPAFDKREVLYERILGMLQNPNLVVQFISLYELLMELLTPNFPAQRPGQKKVCNYFSQNTKKYPDVTFCPSRDKSRKFKEDSFTFLRNKLAHCEDTNNMDLYRQSGNEITCQTIKQLTRAINDVIIEMCKSDKTANP